MAKVKFRKFTKAEQASITKTIANQTNREVLENEALRAIFLTIILFGYYIITSKTEDTLLENIVMAGLIYVTVYTIGVVLSFIERAFAKRKIKGSK